MRGIQIKEYVKWPKAESQKSPKELRVTDLPDPVPKKDDEYLIQVHATAANFFDILQIQGKYQTQPPFPWISGAEFAGTVLQAPSSNPKYPVGARVFGATQGAFATKCLARERELLPIPEGWSYQAAAGLFVTAPTSYGALVVRAGIKPGDIVLVHAAAGGVGLAAVQVAKAFGATVIATASTPRKLEVAKAFGADHVVDYREADWPAKVKALTPKGRGVDIVYDPVGMVDASTKCTAWNGRILIIGFAAGKIEKVAMNKVLLKNISLVGIFWGQYAVKEKETVVEVWKGIMKLVAEGKLRGTEFTDEEFVGLERVPDALIALGSRGTWGKVVVKIPRTVRASCKEQKNQF
ncbi:rab GDP-dissociation inhibitor [Colletotrichum spaethianum]|uniref:Rab GDP-dissociation inhibitor n=1 Tax=Colletotrichum spaethianum TaxID=700344 RepID=A0AA37LBD8_9PEZI|nr:rab GDP-dissociation inhibitor [Colletotrichum spaethianum]GKT43203.1 rab GDP-dissociation inhibitor [Colletotrichum spaethianum]